MLNNCVGKDNRQFVIAYLASTSILMFSIILSAILLFTGATCGDGKDSKKSDDENPGKCDWFLKGWKGYIGVNTG